jgi:Ca2+-transporting ATPase
MLFSTVQAMLGNRLQIASSEDSASQLAAAAHSLDASEVARRLGVDPVRGLEPEDVTARLELYGPNALQTIKPRPAWRVLLGQFTSIVVVLLGVAALISLVTGDSVEAAAIAAVLLINSLVGFLTEWQAERALDALRRSSHTSARALRGGQQMNLDAEDLVPGDIILLNPGDRAPADARLIRAASVRVDESALTGESLPVDKTVDQVAEQTLLAERRSMLYKGTTVVAGSALGVVTGTGMRTELGRIGKLVAEARSEQTPLEKRLAELGRQLVYIVLAIAAVVLIAGWLRGDNVWVMVEVAISLAVAAVPEGLPAVTTLILAVGVLRMARRNAVVRRLAAVETLGSTTIICTDKTGTLTENRMTVREYRLSDGRLIELRRLERSLDSDPLLKRTLRVSVLCNEASLGSQSGGDSRAVGDPTETALLMAGRELGLDVSAMRAEHRKILEIPFDAATRRMVTVHAEPGGGESALLKGAPAIVLEACTRYVNADSRACPLDDESRASFRDVNEEMADRALRVLGLAEKSIASRGRDADAVGPVAASLRSSFWQSDLESGYTFLGLVGMLDPPRREVPAAIEEARAAGIRVIMLTGDQLNTARAIARELRLNGDSEPEAIHASMLAGADRERLVQLATAASVFARVSPQNKLEIVDALEQAGEVVAVTGDGINDAPALKRASIGVAMGRRGTEAAKEAADLVLTDDNFATILKAVEGGRAIYANIVKFVHLMFSENLAEVIVIFTAIVVGWPLPLLPLQILWVNLVTDVFPALALALEPAAPGLMSYPPRSPRSALLSRSFLFLIGWQGMLLAAITLLAYWWALDRYGPGSHARTIALISLVGVQLGHMFNCRSRTRSAFEGLFRNPHIWFAAATVAGLQLLAIGFAPVAEVLGMAALDSRDWAIAVGSVLAPIAVVEATKALAGLSRHYRQ